MKNLVRNFFKLKKNIFLFWLYERVVGGGDCQKYVNIVLWRSQNSSDALNRTNNQKYVFWPFEGGDGGKWKFEE